MSDAVSTAPETTAPQTTTADAAASAPAPEVTSLLDGAAAPETGAPVEAAAEQPAAEPVDYFAALKLPEGVTADDPYLKDAVALFGEGKVAPELAQKLIDFDAKRQAEAVAKWQDEVAELSAKYLQEVKADPEIGGPKLPETMGYIGKAVDKFVPADLKVTLQSYGLGNHPAIAKLLAFVGRQLSEDVTVTGNPPAAQRDALRDWYPNQAKGA